MPERSPTTSSYFWRPDYGIFGYAMAVEEVIIGHSTEDAAVERDLYARGYRWCKCFSMAACYGEWGHVHVAQMRAISKAEFGAAGECGWDYMPS